MVVNTVVLVEVEGRLDDDDTVVVYVVVVPGDRHTVDGWCGVWV